ncbi:DUF1120 domain-containing protein [Citrobacter arsenatis]|uniref:DUF1120 domain-containing protein n=1 Tax=Citrobacter arsenatis TaxID=2546350 RepID=UPI00300E3834
MKKICLSVLVLSALAAGYVQAADTTTVTLTGTITTGSCTPTLSVASIDFGNISTESLSTTHQTTPKESTLTITCDSAMAVGFKFTDNKVDSVDGNNDGTVEATNNAFGIGFTDSNKTTPLGNAVVGVGKDVVSNADLAPLIDGNQAIVLQTNNPFDISTWGTAVTKADTTYTYALAAPAGTEPAAFTAATVPLSVALNLNSADKLNLTADAPIEGQITIDVVYL